MFGGCLVKCRAENRRCGSGYGSGYAPRAINFLLCGFGRFNYHSWQTDSREKPRRSVGTCRRHQESKTPCFGKKRASQRLAHVSLSGLPWGGGAQQTSTQEVRRASLNQQQADAQSSRDTCASLAQVTLQRVDTHLLRHCERARFAVAGGFPLSSCSGSAPGKNQALTRTCLLWHSSC